MRISFLVPLAVASFVQAETTPPHSQFIAYLIESSEAKVRKSPAIAESYADLAFAYVRRARETEDVADEKRAQAAIDTGLKFDLRHFETRKARVLLRLQQHRYADAKEEGEALNKQVPDDNLLYGILADVALARGDYAAAEALSQRMLDLRQVNGPGLQRAAQVREAIGFPDGAAEFWISALKLASTGDTEERAYLLTKLAGFSRRRGKLDEAEQYVRQASGLEPGYPAALVEHARIALEQENPEAALVYLNERLEQSAPPAALYWKWEALRLLGRTADAAAAGERFEKAASGPHEHPAPQDELLIRYYTVQNRAAEAIQAGFAAAASGAGFEVRNAYAMALLKAGKVEQSRDEMIRTLAPGVQNAELFLNAGRIYRQLNDENNAKTYFKKCLEANANSRYGSAALRELQATGIKQ